jgi:hypothetical protein
MASQTGNSGVDAVTNGQMHWDVVLDISYTCDGGATIQHSVSVFGLQNSPQNQVNLYNSGQGYSIIGAIPIDPSYAQQLCQCAVQQQNTLTAAFQSGLFHFNVLGAGLGYQAKLFQFVTVLPLMGNMLSQLLTPGIGINCQDSAVLAINGTMSCLAQADAQRCQAASGGQEPGYSCCMTCAAQVAASGAPLGTCFGYMPTQWTNLAYQWSGGWAGQVVNGCSCTSCP